MRHFISNRNIEIPNIIYGTAWKKYSTSFLVKQAILEGFRAIDTAGQPKHYHEDLVGKGLEDAYRSGIKRESLFLQTKYTPIEGQDKTNMPYLERDSVVTQIEKSFKRSKENLRTKYIDSYLLHSPVFPSKRLLETWDVMSGLVKNKEVGQIGICNCYDLDVLIYLYEKSEIKPSIVQNRFYSQTGYDKEIRKWCKEKSIVYQGFWTLTANQTIVDSSLVFDLSEKYRVNQATIFYRFLNHIGIVPLNGTTNTEHMREDMKINSFELTKNEIEWLEVLLK
ncbi:aldo/keto reductase family protein [Halarcobacter ebronensis]|uniref:aldo/keto reductase family protein n=1 Tax=Halarcobacter ebronensis TaxID=1462615 RepID=UPI001E65DD4F|nr:aldo/keto reductase [Halarcobacter ebronensis]